MGNRHQCIQIIFVSCFKKLNFSYYIFSAITDIAKECTYVHLYLSFEKKSSFCFFLNCICHSLTLCQLFYLVDYYTNISFKMENYSIHIVVCAHEVVSAFRNPVDCSPPASSDHGISQGRILKWAVIFFSRGSSQPRD